MELKPKRRRIWAVLGAAVSVLLVGGLLTPAGAHVTDSVSHLFKHSDKRYVRLLRADRGGSIRVTSSAQTLLSEVTIKAPTDGFLLIQGSATANNDDGGEDDGSQLFYQVDAENPVQGASAAVGPEVVGGIFDPSEVQQLSYVDVVPVNKGEHVVRQLGQIQGSGPNMVFGLPNLVVTFYPGSGAAIK